MATSGTTQNLNEGRGQVLQAFLHSLSSETSGRSADGDKFTSERVRNLSNKLGEILGDIEEKSGGRRNEKGELVNEEGLPILDINEPINPSSELLEQPMPYEDSDLLPLWALGPAERERRRRERDRILDLLEEEERIQEEREVERDQDKTREELERRKEAAMADLEKLKAARELQKKMGKALLRNMAASKEREEQKKQKQVEEDNRALEERKKAATLRPRKSVTFADKPDHDADESKRLTPAEPTPGLGDISLARLQPPGRGLPTSKDLDSGIMKMNVVERFPTTTGPRSPPPFGKYATTTGPLTNADSDDESVPGSPVPADSDEGGIFESDAEESDSNEENVVLDEEYDMDTVQHHREIALAYYEKRSTIGAEAKKAMTSHTHDSEHEWDQPEVPQEATLASPPPKPSISRFKEKRINAYTFSTLGSTEVSSLPQSTSLGTSIIPASQNRELQRAVRTGKMESGKLVGGQEGDSGSDVDADENSREVLEMLRRGAVVNAGPLHEATFSKPQVSTSHQALSQPSTSGPSKPGPSGTQPKFKPQISRFKSAFAAAQACSPAGTNLDTHTTPVSDVERSSPKIPAIGPIVIERHPSFANELSSSLPQSISEAEDPTSSDPARQPPLLRPASVPTAGIQSMVVDSPLFSPTLQQPKPTAIPTAMPPTVVESPSFPTSSIANRPPGVMSTRVIESSGSARQSEPTNGKSKRVSQFQVQRSGD